MKHNLRRIKTKSNNRYPMVDAPIGYPGNKAFDRYAKEHRVVWWLKYGELPPSEFHIHHINGNPEDNRIENLECITPAEHVKKEGHIADLEPAEYIILDCSHCDKQYDQLLSSVNFRKSQGEQKFFCSRSCNISHHNQFKKGTNTNYPKNRKSSGKKGVMLNCKACSKEYYVTQSQKDTSKTCSKACSNVYKSLSRKGVKVPNRKNAIKYVTLECAQCQKEFSRSKAEVRKSIVAGSKNTFCSSRCIAIFNNNKRLKD